MTGGESFHQTSVDIPVIVKCIISVDLMNYHFCHQPRKIRFAVDSHYEIVNSVKMTLYG